MAHNVYEVHVLLEHAVDLVAAGEVLPGFVQLELLACEAIAADLAFGACRVAVVLPDTVPDCLEAVAARTADWLSDEGPALAAPLVEMVGEIRRTVQRA